MRKNSLTFRFLLPVGLALAVIMVAATWAVGTVQIDREEAAFQDRATTLAVASRLMIHSLAADYCRKNGMRFHRVLPGQPSGRGPAADFEREALGTFAREPGLASLARQYREADGTPMIYVLAPATLQEACWSCHSASGLDFFRGRAAGDLVGAFGVSVSTAELHRGVARTRLLAALAGLGVLATIGAIVVFFVDRSILRPLSAMSASITRIGQGDLTARVPVESGDEIGRLQETFNDMARRLDEANRSYMEMLAFVSHELKNPIASMITDARLIVDGYLGPVAPVQAQKLTRLMVHGTYLLGLIRDYLDLARMEGGDLVLRPRRCGFWPEVAEPAIELLLPQIQDRRMTLFRQDGEGPAEVDCDPELLKIVLVNLLGNAVKYGREGGMLRLRVTEGPRAFAVSVWNEGPGFPPEARGELFRKFSRLRTPELRDRKGTGVGLYTAWRIVTLHGGTMEAWSEPGKWAEFGLEIPQPLPDTPGQTDTSRGPA